MTTDYESYLAKIGITDEEQTQIVLDFIETLFNTTIEIMNIKQSKND